MVRLVLYAVNLCEIESFVNVLELGIEWTYRLSYCSHPRLYNDCNVLNAPLLS
jgi:hypothetical protein